MSATGLAQGLLEWAINRALAADPEVRERLGEVEGARIRIVSDPAPGVLDITVHGHRVVLSRPEGAESDDGENPDLTVSGALPALTRLLAPRGARDEALPPGVTVSGDLALARRLRRLARSYRFDGEEVLSRYLGDAGAHEAARRARAAGRWARSAAGTLSRDLAEYLVEEGGVVAGAPALGRFFDAVDELRDDVERLEARIAALSRRVEEERP